MKVLIVSGLFILASCSAVSDYMRKTSIDIPFEQLDSHTDKYVGKNVILGGYVEAARVESGKTRLVVKQAPLGIADQPRSEKRSEGRFYVIINEPVDTSECGLGKDITVAGPILGRQKPDIGGVTAPLLTVKALEIHPWYYAGSPEGDACRGYNPLEDIPLQHLPPSQPPPPRAR